MRFATALALLLLKGSGFIAHADDGVSRFLQGKKGGMSMTMNGKKGGKKGGLSMMEDEPTPIGCQDSTALATGAVLSVDLELSDVAGIKAVEPVQRLLQAMQIGQASITTGGQATDFAHFTYLVDVSGSTTGSCATGQSILDCEKAAILNLNEKIAQSGVAVDVALVKFTSVGEAVDVGAMAGLQILAAPSDPGVESAIMGLSSGGTTNFANGLSTAIDVVKQSLMNPNTNVFGDCDRRSHGWRYWTTLFDFHPD